jgi:hypothetical protein
VAVPTIIPLSLLEALRNLDSPVDDGLEEVSGEIVSKRLGLSGTVAAQIARYEDAVKRGEPVTLEEAISVFRLAGRRPDAQLVFADAGRRVARHAARLSPRPLRLANRVLPGRLGLAAGRRGAVRAAKRALEAALEVRDSGAEGTVTDPLSIAALPDGAACGFYGAAFAELLRVLTGFEGATVHDQCRGRGQPACRWRLTAVGGYD